MPNKAHNNVHTADHFIGVLIDFGEKQPNHLALHTPAHCSHASSVIAPM